MILMIMITINIIQAKNTHTQIIIITTNNNKNTAFSRRAGSNRLDLGLTWSFCNSRFLV